MFSERLPVVALQRREFLAATDQGSPGPLGHSLAWTGP
jgi:hypothetical protein